MKTQLLKLLTLDMFRRSSRDEQMEELQEIPHQASLSRQDLAKLRNFIIAAIEAPAYHNSMHLSTIKTTINLFYSPEVSAVRKKFGITDRVNNLSFEEMAYRKHKPVIEAICRRAQDQTWSRASSDDSIKHGPHHS